jgi:hypothetical protein
MDSAPYFNVSSYFEQGAIHTPHPVDMGSAMSDLEKYLHAPDSLDVLVRAALIHYNSRPFTRFSMGMGA